MYASRVAAGILVTRVLGYVRERVFAYYFGNGAVADAFRAALRIPNALRNLLGEGTLSASFIPVYAALAERTDKAASRALAGAILGLLLLATGVLTVIGIVFAPAITALVAQGFDGARRELTTVLVRILFPMTGLMVVSAWCLGILNTHRRFFLPYAAPALWNVAGIAAMIGAAAWLTGGASNLRGLALALAWGTVAGSVLQIAVQLPACWRLVRGIPLRASVAPEGVRAVLVAWTPLVIGAGVAQLSGLVDTFLASFTGEGGLASLGYAQLIQVLPISLFGVAVAAVSLPELSREAAAAGAGEQGRAPLRNRLTAGFRRIAFFVVPSAFAFVAVGPAIVATLFETGRFDADDSALVGGVLAAYGIGLLGQATVKLFASGFYALRDTRTPVRIAIGSLAVSAIASWLLMRPFGPAGIALGSSIGGVLNMVLQLRALDRRVGPVLARVEWGRLGRVVVASLVAAAAAVGASLLSAAWHPVLRGIAVLGIFGVLYGALTLALRHPDAIRVWQSLTGSPAS